MDILIKNLEPEYAPSEGEHEGKIVRLRIFPNGRVDFINPYNEACIKTEAEAVVLPEHGDLIPYTPTKNAIIKVVGKDNPLWSDIMDEVDKIPVVLEGTR